MQNNQNIDQLKERLVKVETIIEISFKTLNDEIRILVKSIDRLTENQKQLDRGIESIRVNKAKIAALESDLKALQKTMYKAMGAISVLVTIINLFFPYLINKLI